MELTGRSILVTGGASGIGAALCRRFAAESPRGILVADLNLDGAQAVARDVRQYGTAAVAAGVDVSDDREIRQLVEKANQEFGSIDLLCSNAGIVFEGGVEVGDLEWQSIWDVNVMAHVRAARAVLPAMLERGEGYLLQTASAAGLLTNLGAAPYAVTKHAAVALAEWLSITYASKGIKVSCLCPQAVRTPMFSGGEGHAAFEAVAAAGPVAEPEDVAEAVVRGLANEAFLILPHPEVAEYYRRRATDPERWLRGMRRLWDSIS